MMLHPATVHFAIVLPLVASVFGIIYLFKKTESMSKISSRITLIAALAMIGVWYTGTHAGPLIYDYLSPAGQHELKEHKALGTYLAISMGVIALLKLTGCKIKKFALEAFAIILLLIATATTFLQGKDGGEIVYNYGMPFKAYSMLESLHDAQKNVDNTESLDDKIQIYEDAIDDIDIISSDIDKVYGNTQKKDANESD